MTEQTTQPPPSTPTPARGEVSPDDLMNDFRGMSLGRIVLVTVIVHVLFIGVFSIGYVRELIVGPNADLNDEQRMSKALDDGSAELRKIADRYEVNFSDLKSKLDAGRPKPAAPAASTPAAATPASTGAPADKPAEPAAAPDKPDAAKSEIEKELDRKEAGPALPDLSTQPKDDLFAPETP